MAESRTTATDADPGDFIAGLKDERQRADAEQLLALMREVTGAEPRMWGSTMIGFGVHHYRYESGREGDTFVVGFSPRSGRFAIYGVILAPGAEPLLDRLGRHEQGKGCLYVKRLADVDPAALRELVAAAWSGGGTTLRGI